MSALDLLSDLSSFTHISISDKQWQEGNTGRYYYRHPTEPGTVIGWHDIGTNADVELLVFDAVKRRADLVWVPSTAYTDSTLPNIAATNINSTRYIDGGADSLSLDDASRLTEAQLNTLWPASTLDPNTAQYNCDVWSGMGISNYSALRYVRSIMTADRHYANVPNLQQLMRIFCMASVIDALDPTAAANPDLTLGGWFSNGWVWTSTEASSSLMRVVGYGGACNNASKNNARVALPVRELHLL